MMDCGNLLRIALVTVALLVASGLPDEKLTSCCTKVSSKEITEPILKYEVQKAGGSCVTAVIFHTKTGRYCSQLNAPWVHQKIREVRRAKALSTTPAGIVSSSTSSSSSSSTSTSSTSSSSSPSSSVSLLSIISSTTSSASPPTPHSSSSPPLL